MTPPSTTLFFLPADDVALSLRSPTHRLRLCLVSLVDLAGVQHHWGSALMREGTRVSDLRDVIVVVVSGALSREVSRNPRFGSSSS